MLEEMCNYIKISKIKKEEEIQLKCLQERSHCGEKSARCSLGRLCSLDAEEVSTGRRYSAGYTKLGITEVG